MAKALAILALFLALQQDTPTPKVTATPGEPTEKEWPVVGTADLPHESLVQVSARRDDRRYEESSGKFYEVPSDTARKYGTGVVTPRKDFLARLPAVPAAAGMYELIVTL